MSGRTPQEMLTPSELESLIAWTRHFSGNVRAGDADNDDLSVQGGPLSTPPDENFDLASTLREAARRTATTDKLNRWLALGCLLDQLLQDEAAAKAARKVVLNPQAGAEVPGWIRKHLAHMIMDKQAASIKGRPSARVKGREKVAIDVLRELRPFLLLDISPASLVRMLEREGHFGDKTSF